MAIELRNKCIPAITRQITVPLHPLMHGALVSFVYNCGEGALRASTLRRVVNARMWSEVPAQLMKWNKGGGRVLPGLTRRRAAEAKMFAEGVALLGNGMPKTATAGRVGQWRATLSRMA